MGGLTQRAVGAGEKSDAVTLAIATLAIVAAIFWAFLWQVATSGRLSESVVGGLTLGAIITGVVIDTNALPRPEQDLGHSPTRIRRSGMRT